MNILIVFLLSFFISIATYAQTFEWLQTHTIDYEINPEMLLTTTTIDNNGNVYFFGLDSLSQTYSLYAYGKLFLKKYDSEGNLLDTHVVDGEAAVAGIVGDTDGNIYLYGTYLSALNFWDEISLEKVGISANIFLVKIDASGQVLWGKNMSEETEESFSNLMDIITDEQGNTYIAYNSGSNSYVAMLDPDGEIENLIVQENAGGISGISIDSEGNLIVAGMCASTQSNFNGESYEPPFFYNYYLVKYDTEGSPMWVKFVEDITCNFTKVKVDADNNIYWSGPLFVGGNFGELEAQGPEWVFDFYLVKLNPAGDYQWLKEVPEVFTGDASTGSLHFLDIQENGNIVVSGFTRGMIDWGNGNISDGDGMDQDIIIWEFNPDGEVNWVKTAGGTYWDKAHSIVCDANGNIYIAGVAGNTSTFDTIVYQSDDFVYPFLAKLRNETLTSLPDQPVVSELIIYPNPSSHQISIKSNDFVSIKIINTSGQIVYQSSTEHGSSVNISEYPTGVYIIYAESFDGIARRSKFIKN